MPVNLTVGGTQYFAAASKLATMARANAPISSVAPDPYWEQEFAGMPERLRAACFENRRCWNYPGD